MNLTGTKPGQETKKKEEKVSIIILFITITLATLITCVYYYRLYKKQSAGQGN